MSAFYHVRRGLKDYNKIRDFPIFYMNKESKWFSIEKKIALASSSSYRIYKVHIPDNHFSEDFYETGDKKIFKLNEENYQLLSFFPITKLFISNRENVWQFHNFTNLGFCHEFLENNFHGIDATDLEMNKNSIYQEGVIWSKDNELKLNLELSEIGIKEDKQLRIKKIYS